MVVDNMSQSLASHTSSKLLICGDSQSELALLTEGLTSVGYKHIAFTTDSKHLIARLNQAPVDLLLLDLTTQAENVVEAIAILRRRYSHAELPILVITDADSQATRNTALAAGVNDYVNKPFDSLEVVLRVRNLLTLRASYVSNQISQQHLETQVRARTAKLDTLIANGLLMASTRDVSQLFHHAIFEGKRLLNCDAATLYLVTKDKLLQFALRTKDDELPRCEIPLVDPQTGQRNVRYVSVYAATHRKSVLIDDLYQEDRFDVSGTKCFDAQSNYRTVSMLTVPMVTPSGVVLGILQFINKLDPVTHRVIPFPASWIALVEALAAQAAVAYENLQLLDERKAFMESLIHTIATAIDAKSPYTGRHSERVPELAIMLAKAASEAKHGPLADFDFATDDEWHEFRVGAWLHDCGKIATPEHIIDKATKLEAIHNRLHEVRLRFEVLRRDAEIQRLHVLQDASPAQALDANAAFDARVTQLEDDFAFIAQCNIGTEAMSDVDVERVRRIGQTRWTRYFDDRLGLSSDELQRRATQPAAILPEKAPLLEDAIHHLIERSSADLPDPAFGFKVDVPHYLYNLGEVYNLTVRRGTLTAEDRYKINEHMIHGIKMLERMPFPDSLKRVPEYASTHHETLTGTGYPRRLTAKDLSIPARIMVIADIFEALTAADRPYKAPKKFSEALSILYSLKMKGHIDPDLFDLFVSSGVHLNYARQFLLPEQIDIVEFDAYLGPVVPT